MTAEALERDVVEQTSDGDVDDRHRVPHAVCPTCYPQTPQVGEIVRRVCGIVSAIRSAPLKRGTFVPCVVCEGLTRCDVCGQRFRDA